jgi:cell wall-associated NlpC family hydrolase
MANRIIWTAAITLALILSPGLAQAVPTKGVNKKSSTKSQAKVTKKSKSSKSSKYNRKRSSRRSYADEGASSSPAPYRAGVAETPPLMKVVPQRDGKFLLEPMSPKKTPTPLTKPSSKPEVGSDRVSTAEPKFNRFEPWDFSDLVLTQAKSYKDTPYARGGSLERGNATDCSGFVQYIYHGFKIDLPRSSCEQAQVGKVVTHQMDFSKMLPGDLLFFSRGGRSVGHAGIYLGEGRMIHASNHRNGVTVTDLRQPYYEGTFVVAKRVFEVKYPN